MDFRSRTPAKTIRTEYFKNLTQEPARQRILLSMSDRKTPEPPSRPPRQPDIALISYIEESTKLEDEPRDSEKSS